ncbi:MAG: glycosyltransferase family 4 protein [FCB group bacterium]|nr:glycosyltransferase family 4 protein [FCB group bacterium]
MSVKVLYIITRLDQGGSAEAVMQWAAGMLEAGYETKLVTGRSEHPQEDFGVYSRRTGVPIIAVESLHRELELGNDWRAYRELKRIIRAEKPDIVHTNSSKAGILGRLSAKSCRVRVIVHSPHGHIFYGYYGRLKTAVFIAVEKWAAKFTGRITNLTQLGLEDHLKFKIGPRKKFTVIYAGIDTELYAEPSKSREEVLKELGIPEGKFVVGWVARFADIKNPLMMVKAGEILSGNPDYHFLMAGDGELYGEAVRYVKDKGLEQRFTFTGYRTDIPDLLSVMDVYCLTSKNEGLGRSILEAQAAGVPVIATEVGGVPEIVEHEFSGILIPSRDVTALCGSLVRINAESALRKKLVKGASLRLNRFSLKKTLVDIDKLYQELLS